jgi:hypothetical protein
VRTAIRLTHGAVCGGVLDQSVAGSVQEALRGLAAPTKIKTYYFYAFRKMKMKQKTESNKAFRAYLCLYYIRLTKERRGYL